MRTERSSVHRVLDFLLDQEAAVTRPAIAAACNLSRPTVFAAVQQLEDRRLVRAVGVQSGSLGRSAALYEIAPEAGSLVAVDIGGSNLRVAVTDLRGLPSAERQTATAAPGGPAIVAQALDLVDETLTAAGVTADSLARVAVSVPGVVAADGKTVSHASNIDQVEPFDFATPFSDALDAPAVLENNVNLAALAERPHGAHDLSPYVVVAIGAGIGAGVVHRGRLLRGAHGAAGEVAFLPGSPPDGVTSRHDAAGGLTLLEAARERHWEAEPPATVEELFARADCGEEPALSLVEEECSRIVSVLAAICAVVDPSTVILTGGVGTNPRLLERVTSLAATTLPFPPEVVGSQLGKRASLLGAIQVAAQGARRQLLDSLGG